MEYRQTANDRQRRQYSIPVHWACTAIEVLRHKMLDFIIERNWWLPNISHRILAVVQVCQQPVKDVDELRQLQVLVDSWSSTQLRQCLIKRLINEDLGFEHELQPETDSFNLRFTRHY